MNLRYKCVHRGHEWGKMGKWVWTIEQISLLATFCKKHINGPVCVCENTWVWVFIALYSICGKGAILPLGVIPLRSMGMDVKSLASIWKRMMNPCDITMEDISNVLLDTVTGSPTSFISKHKRLHMIIDVRKGISPRVWMRRLVLMMTKWIPSLGISNIDGLMMWHTVELVFLELLEFELMFLVALVFVNGMQVRLFWQVLQLYGLQLC